MNFHVVKEALKEKFNEITKDHVLYEVDLDQEKLWALYLNSFPAGANPMYRVRTEHDCSCCRHFIKEIGKTVYFDDDLNIHSIFEFDTNTTAFQNSMDKMAEYVKGCKIVGVYFAPSEKVGTEFSRELEEDGTVVTYEHFAVDVPRSMVYHGHKTVDTEKGRIRDTKNVFKRSLDEITVDAIETVLELIRSNTLYKGAEWENAICELLTHKQKYDGLDEAKKDSYCWKCATTVGSVIGRIRNHSIGVLLTDISEGKELDSAVRSYEKIVAPTNYKRPKAIYTKKMLEQAEKTITELGYMDSLPRRFATLDDIKVNNILFSNKDAAKRISGSVFDEMKDDIPLNPKQFSRVEEITAENFVSNVLPYAKSVEAFIENRHAPNFVSLIAPVNSDAKTMFKWNNGFSWAYSGNVTDSDIRENVKNAGGKVDGVLRFSIQWNDRKEHDENDLDAHCIEPSKYEIYYAQRWSPYTKGNLDVDIIHPELGEPAVENITYPLKNTMNPGKYLFFVRCFSYRGGQEGFRAEIEFDGQVYSYDYAKSLKRHEDVIVAAVTLGKDGTFTIQEKLPSAFTSREYWGIKTQTFVPVSVVMYSPNYWDEQRGIGHKHYMFMLNGCVNQEHPNGFYNEFLRNELDEHKRVLEALGSKMSVKTVEDQLSGIGFSSTKRNDLIVKVKGSTERIMKIKF